MRNKALRLLVGSSAGLATTLFSQPKQSYADKQPVQTPKAQPSPNVSCLKRDVNAILEPPTITSEPNATNSNSDMHEGMKLILKYEDLEAFIGRIVAIDEQRCPQGPYKDKCIVFALIDSQFYSKDIPSGIVIDYLINKSEVGVCTRLTHGQMPRKKWMRLATTEELSDLRRRAESGSSRFFTNEIFRPGVTVEMIDHSLELLSDEIEEQKMGVHKP